MPELKPRPILLSQLSSSNRVISVIKKPKIAASDIIKARYNSSVKYWSQKLENSQANNLNLN